jgi:peroxiredoxin
MDRARRAASFALGLAVLAAARLAAESGPSPPAIGAAVKDFTLPDIHRRPRSLADFKDRKAFVVVFAGTECPVANLYIPTLIALDRKYGGQGVQFLLVNSNRHDPFAVVSAHAQERDLPFPVLKDFDQRVADSLGARRTPEAVLLDAGRAIRYRGRIDDQYGIGYRREQPARRDLEAAIAAVLAGEPVVVAETEASGCLITRAPPRARGKVTYAEHVAPIIQRSCQGCHRPGEIAPFPLLDYRDARGRAQWIREVVLEERMPPWHADPRFGRFENDRRLSAEDRDTLLAWVEDGSPEGDREKAPPAKEWIDGWQIGTPDRVFAMPEEFQVPAAGVLGYQHFTVDPGLERDVWVQAAECRPGNRAVVHHILVYLMAPGQKNPYAPDGTVSTLAGWAPGDMPARHPHGFARRVPAGSRLLFEVHYTPNGTAQADRSSVGIVLAKGPPGHAVEMNVLANMLFEIPPGARRHQGETTFTFRQDALVLSFVPHMHYRGISARYEATYPDGKTETLLSVPDFDFDWQSVYRFAEPKKVPGGTKLKWIGWWDNSADNPRNPDATKEVSWGLQTWEEMQNGWMEFVWLEPEKP